MDVPKQGQIAHDMMVCLKRLEDRDPCWSERQLRYFDACVAVVYARMGGEHVSFPEYTVIVDGKPNMLGRTYIAAAVVAIVRHLGYFPLDRLYDQRGERATRAFEMRVQAYMDRLKVLSSQ
jgi:hypothetical protein